MTNINFFIIIRFGHSKSANYAKALKLLKTFPTYTTSIQKSDFNECKLNGLEEYETYVRPLRKLVSIVGSWKSTEITVDGKNLSANDYFNFERDYYSEKDKAYYYPSICGGYGANSITIETLPYPIVYYPDAYGTFFAFKKSVDSEFAFCSCTKPLVENYQRLLPGMGYNSYTNLVAAPFSSHFFPRAIAGLLGAAKNVKFEDKLCHRCNMQTPTLTYCHPMYGSKFKQTYGWYINQNFLRLGINPFNINQYIADICPPELRWNAEESNSEKEINNFIENMTRQEFGVKKIGDAWVSETILYNIICKIFPKEKILRHHRPDWLNGLELDVYLPNKKLAFEYQGQQHFMPIKHWGGEESLRKVQEHDRIKLDLCQKSGIRLILVNYYDPLTEDFVSTLLPAKKKFFFF